METLPDWKNGPLSRDGIHIGHDTVIRENVIINLPATDVTKIGSNCYIMNTCYIGHDSKLGDNVTVAPHACIAGFVTIGDYTFIGMNSSIHQHSTIGKCCMIGASSFFKGNSPDGLTWAGVPARPIKVNRVGIERSSLNQSKKDEMILNAQLFIDGIKSLGNIKTEEWITSPRNKTRNIFFNCIRWFNITNIFNKIFRCRIPS